MGGLQDDFKGFGDGADGFPKRVPDDCVEYSLFIIDSRLKSQKELFARLETVRKESLKLTESLLKEYIWQRESFKLGLENGKGTMYLHGLTNYGDSVEDEWLIVYILKELSNRFPDLWIKVVDTDGEFLLIEAANALPRWLNPEIADNRVWIHNETLRIIPVTPSATSSSKTKTAPISRSLTLDEAFKTITSNSNILMHSPLIEEEAFYRLRSYPSQITASLHYALITIPRKLAYILHNRPAAIAPAVEVFYLRDPIALKPLQTSSSDLVFPPQDLVTISIRFTRVLFAQVKSQKFSPPIAWQPILSQADENNISAVSTRNMLTQLEMGMKVTSGFEMLVSHPSHRDNRIIREVSILLDDLAGDDASGLPTDQEISKWQDVNREDDDGWMDINFEDFEKELQGKNQNIKDPISGPFRPEPQSGFGDAKTQADLKKMVERFEAFLNDDDAGMDGAEVDDMDVVDDDDDESEYGSGNEDKDVSFDENEFARMMREMMGMPSEEDVEEDIEPSGGMSAKPGNNRSPKEVDSDEGSDGDGLDETDQIRKVMEKMEAELNEAGALNLDPTPSKLAALKGKGNREKEVDRKEHQDWEDESDDEDVNIDFNLAKNLLESFKSQAGMAGPGGNLLGIMGMQMPRDEDDNVSLGER